MTAFIPLSLKSGAQCGLRYDLHEHHLSLPTGIPPAIADPQRGPRSPHPPLESIIFGYRIPWLVDFASDPIYAGGSVEKTVSNLLTHWVRALHGLWVHHTAAFSLRFVWDPAHGSLNLGLLCRFTGSRGQTARQLDGVSSVVETLLHSLHLPCAPLKTEHELSAFLALDRARFLQELRQQEALLLIEIPALREIQYGYVIYPFTGPDGTWIDVLRTIVAQSSPVLVNLHIQPTTLLSHEFEAMNRAAQIAKELSDLSYQGLSGQIQIRSHTAVIAHRLYATLAQRLEKPFLIAAQVVGDNASAVSTTAAGLGAALTARALTPAETQEQELRSGFQVFDADDHTRAQAERTLTQLWLTDWGFTEASDDLQRLRYLADARGAAAVFRLPVPAETGLPGIEVRKLQLGHETGRRTATLPADHILLGTQSHGGLLSIAVQDLARHTLVCGIPGSGKTNTSLSMLSQLWRDHHIPFWVLEPPKTEYRGLLQQPGFEDILVFTVGDEGTAPLRLNPFELLPGVRVEEHINNLGTCFAAGLPKIDDSGTLLPMFLDEAVRDIYKQKGWRSGDRYLGTRDTRAFPTLHDLYAAAQKALAGYAGEVKQNLTAAINNRIRSLLRGSKGRMFNIERGIPVEHLMTRPVVFELLTMGDDAPLVLMFLLTLLREHAQRREEGHLQNVPVIEEAHVIMANAGPDNTVNAAAGVANAFERMLAELRSAGEGVFIAEQSPTKLIKGAIDLTNLKIVHRLAGPAEVTAVGGAITATEAQRETFQRLGTGEAALFMEGLQGLTFIKAPNFKGENRYRERLRDDVVIDHMEPYYQQHPSLRLPFHGCTFCTSQCRFRENISDVMTDAALQTEFRNTGGAKAQARTSTNDAERREADKKFYTSLRKAAQASGHLGDIDAAWCYWVQSVDEDFIFQRGQRSELERWMAELAATA